MSQTLELVAASSQHASATTSGSVFTEGITLWAIFEPDTVAADGTILCLGKAVSGHNFMRLGINSSGYVQAQWNTPDATGDLVFLDSASISAGNIYAAVATFPASGSMVLQIAQLVENGSRFQVIEGTAVTAAVPTKTLMEYDDIEVSIGRRILGTGSYDMYFDGKVHRAAAFNFVANSAMRFGLIQGMAPDIVMGSSYQPTVYYELEGGYTDKMGNLDLTAGGSPTFNTGVTEPVIASRQALNSYTLDTTARFANRSDGTALTTTEKDEYFFVISGTASNLTYEEHGGGSTGDANGVTMAAASGYYVLRSAPGAIWHLNPHNLRLSPYVTWTTTLAATSGNSQGGMMFIKWANSDGYFGSDGAGYFCFIKNDGGTYKARLSSRPNDSTAFTELQLSAALNAQSGNVTFRARLEPVDSSPTQIQIIIEEDVSSVWTERCSQTVTANADLYALAFVASGSTATDIWDVEVGYSAQHLVLHVEGQSEPRGAATDGRQDRADNTGETIVTRDGGTFRLANENSSRGWAGTAADASRISGWSYAEENTFAGDTANGGSCIPNLLKRIAAEGTYPSVIATAIGLEGGTTLADHISANMDDVNRVDHMRNSADFMTWLLAGDGEDVPLRYLFWDVTSDIAQAQGASYATRFDSIRTRWLALTPTLQIWVVKNGSKHYLDPDPADSDETTIRAAIESQISTYSYVHLLYDEAGVLGAAGSGDETGWGTPDIIHPNAADNDQLSIDFFNAMFPGGAQLINGGLINQGLIG